MEEQKSETTKSPYEICRENKPKRNALLFAVVGLSVLAVGGVSFGIFGMLRNTNGKVGAETVTNNKGVNASGENYQDNQAQDETGLGESELPNPEPVSVVERPAADSGPYVADGYFFVPRWGVKFKVPSDVADFGYAVTADSLGDTFSEYVIGATAIKKSDVLENPQAQYYHDIFSCSLITVRDFTRDKWVQTLEGLTNIDVAYFDNHSFVVHDTWREENCARPQYNSSYVNTDAVTQELKEMFLHPEKM